MKSYDVGFQDTPRCFIVILRLRASCDFVSRDNTTCRGIDEWRVSMNIKGFLCVCSLAAEPSVFVKQPIESWKQTS